MNKTFFGTDGIRAIVGKPPLTAPDLFHLGYVIGDWFYRHGDTQKPIIIAHDGRSSGPFIRSALLSGLTMSPLTFYDADLLSTPAVCALIRHSDTFGGGIIISASHNPYYDNGIKIINGNGDKIGVGDEQWITHQLNRVESTYVYPSLFGKVVLAPELYKDYINIIKARFQTLSLDGLTMVLDCAHGATSVIAPMLFRACGARVIAINTSPNGVNINDHCGSVYPATLQQAVIDHGADIGCAFDGDGDRIIMVNHAGEVKDGDDLLVILSGYRYYSTQPVIVGTIMSNQGIATHLRTQGKQLIRVAVGDKEIAKKLDELQVLLGGEPSGHIIMRDYLSSGDGVYTALCVIEALLAQRNWSCVTFVKYPQLLINIPVTHKRDLRDPIIASIIAEHQSQVPQGRVEVRYSGTEPVLRIMVEDVDEHHARNVGAHLSKNLQETLQVTYGVND